MPRMGPRSTTGTASRPLTVLVGGRDALERELVCFFLEEEEILITDKVSLGVDAVRQAARSRPDAVILFESVGETSGLIKRLRRASPHTKIVVITPAPQRSWRGSLRGADAFIDEWVGLRELENLLLRLCSREPVGPKGGAGSDDERIVATATSCANERAESPRAHDAAPVWRGHWQERIQGGVAASVLLIALFLVRGGYPASRLTAAPAGSPAATTAWTSPETSAHLREAFTLLERLVAGVGEDSPGVTAANAQAVMRAREDVLEAGGDVSRLDDAIMSRLSPLLPELPNGTALATVSLLVDVADGHGPPSGPPVPFGSSVPPTPTPEVSPTPEASPTSEPNPTATPTQTDTPTPTETPTPTDTPTDDASATDTSSNGDSSTGGELPTDTVAPSQA
jgi:hypothetical protein